MPGLSTPRTRVPKTYMLDVEVVEYLNQQAGNPRCHGQFLGRCVYEHKAREEERVRLTRVHEAAARRGDE